MRIYSEDPDSLDQFIGKDIWVKVYYEDYEEYGYARIIKKLSNGEYRFNGYFEDDDHIENYSDIADFIEDVLRGEFTGDLEPVLPFETIAEEDLPMQIMKDCGYTDG